MPSYRKDRPSRPGPSEHRGPPERREAEEEEREERPRSFRSSSFVRPGFEPMAPRPAERRSWSDFVVPASEKADPNYKYSRVFTIFAPGGRAAAGPERQAPPPPRQERSQRSAPPEVDPSVWFDQSRIWNAVQTVRQDSRFRVGSPVAVVQVSNPIPDDQKRAEEMIRFFRIPRQDVERYQPSQYWPGLLNPFLDELAYAINYAKPREIPGTIRFQKAPDGSMWMAYQE